VWNPVKELKALGSSWAFITIYSVESGEGIESHLVDLLERFEDSNRWNPVKELKGKESHLIGRIKKYCGIR